VCPITNVSTWAISTVSVDSAVFQRTIDYPDAFSPGYHVIISDGPAVTVRWDQVRAMSIGVEEDQ